MSVDQSLYNQIMKGNNAILGTPIDLSYNSGDVSKAIIKFKIENQYVNDVQEENNGADSVGIKRYNVFKYYEGDNLLLPVATTYDEENKIVLAEVSSLGTYCIVDLKELVKQWRASEIYDEIDMDVDVSYINYNKVSLSNNDDNVLFTINSEAQSSPKKDILAYKMPDYIPAKCRDEMHDHLYALLEPREPISYIEAERRCELLGGHLVTITSDEEQNFIIEHLLGYANKYAYWIGGTKEINSWKWKWCNNEKFGYLPNDIPCVEESQEKHLQIWKSLHNVGIATGTWISNTSNGANDSSNYAGYICEWGKLEDSFNYVSASGLAVNVKLDAKLKKWGETDTDNDGLTDSQEVNWQLMRLGELPTLRELIREKAEEGGYFEEGRLEIESKIKGLSQEEKTKLLDQKVLPILSDPVNEDGDGDGLLDGKPKMIKGEIVGPKDPNPLKANGPIGVWQAQFTQVENGNIANGWGNEQAIDDTDWSDWGTGWAAATTRFERMTGEKADWSDYGSVGANIGAQILNFRWDDMKQALHAQVDTWQMVGGYNDIYDWVFKWGTGDNMSREKFYFKDSNGEDYVVWAWRGDYLNLGSGAEVGLYKRPINVPLSDLKLWQVSDIHLPMTLNLYNYDSEAKANRIFCWAPDERQWWITGFAPNFRMPDKNKMVVIGSIDFSGHEDMYSSLKKYVGNEPKVKDYMIFDEDGHTVWMIWWRK